MIQWASAECPIWSTAREAEQEIVVIKKTSKEFSNDKDPIPCPSVVVNGRVIALNDSITYQSLKTAIMCDCEI
jgi:hypothetical protein